MLDLYIFVVRGDMMKKIGIKIAVFTIIVLICIGGWVGYDVVQNNQITKTTAKDDYARSLKNPINAIMIDLEEGKDPDYSELKDTLAFIDGRYDTADFRLPSMIRILYSHDSKLPEEVATDLKDTVINFKYWMDQPGDDSMCYWSENHQILFASSEYLLGHYYGDEMFANMGITGEEHSELGKERVLTWLEQRFLYGFTEWYSSTYYVEDIAPLAVLVDFAPDEEVRIKAAMILDLMIYDLATQNYKGTFTANSGRMYESAKMTGTKGSMKETIAAIWPDYNQYIHVDNVGTMEANFYYVKNYEVPEVLVNIGYDQEETHVYKASTGINLSEFEGEGFIGQADNQIMMQMACEAFTNPEVIGNTIEYIDRTGMFTNEFVHDFKLINMGFLRTFNLTPLISKVANPMYNGTVIERANTYMYRTPMYAMSTAQAYHPGMYGDQHSLFSLNINNDFNIFVQQPAAALSEDGALGSSPNYWVGNGYHPHTVQEENVNINLFVLPEKVNPIGDIAGMARDIEHYTHAYFPKQHMDEVVIEGRYAFARIKDVYVALIGKNNLNYKPLEHNAYDQKKGFTDSYDLIQEGIETYWITEVGTSQDYVSFEVFRDEVLSRPVSYENRTLSYENLELTFMGDFKVNGQVKDLEYQRFESDYSTTERKAQVITFEFQGQKLALDFYKLRREVTN